MGLAELGGIQDSERFWCFEFARKLVHVVFRKIDGQCASGCLPQSTCLVALCGHKSRTTAANRRDFTTFLGMWHTVRGLRNFQSLRLRSHKLYYLTMANSRQPHDTSPLGVKHLDITADPTVLFPVIPEQSARGGDSNPNKELVTLSNTPKLGENLQGNAQSFSQTLRDIM
jgi:hypothetical protein